VVVLSEERDARAGTVIMRALVAGAVAALAFAPGAPAAPQITKGRAIVDFLEYPKVAAWVARYPEKGRVVTADHDRKQDLWRLHVWWQEAGEIAIGKVGEDGHVIEAWTGPQVAWSMARGYPGTFGGKTINSLPVWLGFCLVFLLGLVDWRRPLAVRNLDLLALLSFSVSLWFFQDGDVFTSVPLAYPPLAYLLVRTIWVAARDVPPRGRPIWPAWVLAAAAVFLLGFRTGLDVSSSQVVDVGYSGVVGAHRIAHGQAPYGHFPVSDANLKPCGPANAEGDIENRVQTNGRCETANPSGDTYGPVAYIAYLPAFWTFGWNGTNAHLMAAKATAILFDALCLLGLVLVGRRYGGARLAAILAFAWTAYPFTQYVLNSNTNDSVAPAFLIWGFWLAGTSWARGAFCALGGWTKFFSLPLAPLWLSYDRAAKRPVRVSGPGEGAHRNRDVPPRASTRNQALFLAGFAAATLAAFSVLLLEPNPVDAARVFWDRTLGWQLDRPSPFSLWDWGQYHAAGIPDLAIVRRVLEGLVIVGAFALYVVPRRKSPLRLASLTAAVLVGVQVVVTHWFYFYIPWFFPFAAFALLAVRPAPAPAEPAPIDEHEPRALVAAG
jgi:hypothetical protein